MNSRSKKTSMMSDTCVASALLRGRCTQLRGRPGRQPCSLGLQPRYLRSRLAELLLDLPPPDVIVTTRSTSEAMAIGGRRSSKRSEQAAAEARASGRWQQQEHDCHLLPPPVPQFGGSARKRVIRLTRPRRQTFSAVIPFSFSPVAAFQSRLYEVLCTFFGLPCSSKWSTR